jgi:hypothetical protein
MKKNFYTLLLSTLFFTSISIASNDFSIEEISKDLIVFSQNGQQGLIVINESNSIIVDPMSQETTMNIQKFLVSNSKPMISRIIYSHSHWDRISTGKATLNEDIEVIAQQECSLYLSNNKNVIAPTVYFQDYFEIISGGKKIDLYYFGPSHGECMIVIHLVEENLLFIPDLLHTKGASFPTDATLPYLRPSTLINFFNELEKLAQKKKIKSFIGGYTEDKLIGSTSIIAEQRIFWELMQTTAEQAEVDGIINLDNFIDLEKLDLEPYQQYDNFNKDDLINIIRRYTSFQNMGR